MTFRDKIDKIIATNPYMITSVNGLEIFCGIGTSSLQRCYTENEESSIKVVKKIIRALHVPHSWWDNPIGDPFIDPFKVYQDFNARIEALELENEKLHRKNTILAKRVTILENRPNKSLTTS
jgi:hypothetical protein